MRLSGNWGVSLIIWVRESNVLIKIKSEDLQKLENFTQEVREKALKQSMHIALTNTVEYVSRIAASRLKNNKLLNLKKVNLKKRVHKSRNITGSTINEMSAYIRFSTFNEYLSDFPMRKTRATGTDGKNYPSFIFKVLGKDVGPLEKMFVSNIKHMSLQRLDDGLVHKKHFGEDKGRDSDLDKFSSDSTSISDLLNFDKSLLKSITDDAKARYTNEVSRQIHRTLYAMENDLRKSVKK